MQNTHYSTKPSAPKPQTCVLTHKSFSNLSDITFRKSATDNVPVMAVQMGEREVLVPLKSLKSTLGIEESSDDGRMLTLIAESLDYVTTLRVGEKLPAEVVSGEASWTIEPVHLQIAVARLRMQLIAWLDGATGIGGRPDADAMQKLTDDPATRQRVQQAMTRAAQDLGLAGSDEVVKLIEELAGELAYVEALRDRLLRRIHLLAGHVEKLMRLCAGAGAAHTDSLNQVQRLTTQALKVIGGKFEELDAQTGTVLVTLRNADTKRNFIRSRRDWLYRAYRTWEALLDAWDAFDPEDGEQIWPLVGRTYHFLAPRFMPETEWVPSTRPLAPKEKGKDRVVW